MADKKVSEFASTSAAASTDLLHVATPSTTNKKITIADFRGYVDVRDYGAKGDGSTDDSTAFNAASSAIASTGGTIFIPPGTYLLSSQWLVTTPAAERLNILAYGAEITTTGSIAGVRLTGGDSTGGCTIYGLQVNHRGNSDATFGFELYATWNARLVDCSVESYDTAAGYAAYLLRQGSASDGNTGCFWTVLDHCHNRRRSGSDGTVVEAALRLRGTCNATNVINCNLGDATTCIHHTIESGQTTVSNSLLVQGCHFEGYTTAYHMEGATTSNYAGFRSIGNRFENGTTVYSFTTTTTQPSGTPVLVGNYYVSDAGTHINNPNGLYVNNLDSSVSPAIVPSEVHNGPKHIRALGGGDHALRLEPGGANRGLAVENTSNGDAVMALWQGTGTKGILRTTSASELALSTCQGISADDTDAQNLRGAATFATAATASVSFSTAEPDATYFVAISGDAQETFWVTAKGTGGFTLNSSNASSTATVDWVLIR